MRFRLLMFNDTHAELALKISELRESSSDDSVEALVVNSRGAKNVCVAVADIVGYCNILVDWWRPTSGQMLQLWSHFESSFELF